MSVDAGGEGAFAAALLDPDAPVPAMVKGRTPRRYAVYRNNVTVGLVRAMEANFPAIRKLLGETYFAGLARAFVQSHPPQSPLLFHYGEGFARFLTAQDDLTPYPYLADVARLEQLWRRAYHAADAAILAPDALSALDEDELMTMRLLPHPAMALLASPFAVHAIFAANRGGTGLVDDPARAECVLVTRPGLEVDVRRIDLGTHAFLSCLASGIVFADAAELAFGADPAFDLAAAIRLMVEAGAFQSTTMRAIS